MRPCLLSLLSFLSISHNVKEPSNLFLDYFVGITNYDWLLLTHAFLS